MPEYQQPPNLHSTPHRWCAAWSQADPTHWLSLYHPTAIYTDHAFRLIRLTPSSLQTHFIIWRTANPDFLVTIDPTSPIYWSDSTVDDVAKVMFRTMNTGTNLQDMPTVRASGRGFSFSAVVEVTVGKGDGLIREVQEWYSRDFNACEVGSGYVLSR